MIKGNKFYFFKRLIEKHIPLHVQMELTTKCNNDCIHCIREKNIENELTSTEIKGLLLELREAGCMQLTFTGGEPLLREDFFDICKFANSKGFVLRLFSNATLINKAVAKRLKELRFKEIRITVFSIREEVHDAITQIPGSLRKTLQALRFLSENRITFRISAIIMKRNINALAELKAKAQEENWPFSWDPTIYPTYSGLKYPVLNRITNKEIEFLRNKRLLRCKKYQNINSKRNELNYFYLGNLHCYISADGRVFPHASIRLQLGDFKKQSFKEIWKNSSRLNWLRNLSIEDFACSGCAYFLHCPWCLGLAYPEEGKITARPKEYCRIASILREQGKK